MTDPDIVIISIVIATVALFKLALAVLLIESAHLLRDGGHEQERPVLGWLLRIFAWVLVGVHGSMACWVVTVGVVSAIEGVIDPEEVSLTVAAVCVAATFIVLARTMLQTAGCIGVSPDDPDVFARDLNRKLAVLSGVGLVLIIALAILGLILLISGGPDVFLLGLILVILVVGPIATVALAAHGRNSRQANLLWLLAIAVKGRFSLPDEIEAHANAQVPTAPLSWTFLWHPWRYLAILLVLRRYRERLLSLADTLRHGTDLAEALEQHGGLVPHAAVLAIRVGSATGTLDATLAQVAAHHAARMQQRVLFPTGTDMLIYAITVLWILVAIVSFQMYWIVPKLKKIFMDFGTELPHVTVTLISVTDFCVQFWFLVLGPPLILSVFLLLVAFESHQKGFEELKIPWFMRWFPRVDTPGLLRNLKRMVMTKRPLVEGLGFLSTHHHRVSTCERLDRAKAAGAGGRDVWQSLDDTGFLTLSQAAVLQAAERADNLPWGLETMADRIEQSQRYQHRWCTELVRPVAIFILGMVVAFILVAFFMPLIKIINDLS